MTFDVSNSKRQKSHDHALGGSSSCQTCQQPITEAKEHPILFSGAMVRAILEPRKTQTRRVIKLPSWSTQNWDDLEVYDDGTVEICASTGCSGLISCPYGAAGHHLWVRETWLQSPADNSYWYKADAHEDGIAQVHGYKWKPSIHMPRAASRINLKVTNIRVERLQDISEEDAIAEGIQRFDDEDLFLNYQASEGAWAYENWFTNPIDSFRSLWDSINVKRGYGWESNPWVWAISFSKQGEGGAV